jgi:mRNA-degrading endonuclease RelE of RelBE toxin-antitoxin system
MPYRIEVSISARTELSKLPANVKPVVVAAIDQQLTYEPLGQSRNRKPLRDEVTANFAFTPPLWELSVGDYRVFYDVDEKQLAVVIRAVRQKLSSQTTAEVLNE